MCQWAFLVLALELDFESLELLLLEKIEEYSSLEILKISGNENEYYEEMDLSNQMKILLIEVYISMDP